MNVLLRPSEADGASIAGDGSPAKGEPDRGAIIAAARESLRTIPLGNAQTVVDDRIAALAENLRPTSPSIPTSATIGSAAVETSVQPPPRRSPMTLILAVGGIGALAGVLATIALRSQPNANAAAATAPTPLVTSTASAPAVPPPRPIEAASAAPSVAAPSASAPDPDPSSAPLAGPKPRTSPTPSAPKPPSTQRTPAPPVPAPKIPKVIENGF